MTTDRTGGGVHLGFACSWWHPREPTWSYTPAGLLRALSDQDRLTITSIDAQRPLAGKAAMALAYRYSGTAWQHGRLNRWFTQRKILRETLRSGSDVVLAMSVTEPLLPVPTFLYQDMATASYGSTTVSWATGPRTWVRSPPPALTIWLPRSLRDSGLAPEFSR